MRKSVGLRGKEYVFSQQTLLCLQGLALSARCGFEVVGCLEHKQSFTAVPGLQCPFSGIIISALTMHGGRGGPAKQALPRDAALGTL